MRNLPPAYRCRAITTIRDAGYADDIGDYRQITGPWRDSRAMADADITAVQAAIERLSWLEFTGAHTESAPIPIAAPCDRCGIAVEPWDNYCGSCGLHVYGRAYRPAENVAPFGWDTVNG